MYETQTFDLILERMLARIDTDIDKSEGSLIYNALAPEAWELANAYIAIDAIYDATFADTAPREELILRAAERGLALAPATYAILKGEFNQDITVGDRFSLDDLNYVAIEKISTGVWKMQCETAGTYGNKKFGTLIPIEYIEGLTSANLTELLIPGEEEEGTEEFRARYFASFDSQAFGGNIADYISKTESITGVGGAKYYRASKENSHIKVLIINSDFGVPSSTLVDFVQEQIDPRINQGEGVGFAPIGHIVDVEGCIATPINISATFTLDTGYTWADVSKNIESVIDKYLLELAKTWADNSYLTVRLAQIEARILNIDGVIDIANTTINNAQSNLILESNAIPVRGSVSAN